MTTRGNVEQRIECCERCRDECRDMPQVVERMDEKLRLLHEWFDDLPENCQTPTEQ